MNDKLQAATSGEAGLGKTEGRFGRWIAGRSHRRNFLAWLIPMLVIVEVLGSFGVRDVGLIVGLPVLFAMIRRLHDLGMSGWWAFWINVGVNSTGLITKAVDPEVGLVVNMVGHYLVYLVLAVIPGQRKANIFGPVPGAEPPDLSETFA